MTTHIRFLVIITLACVAVCFGIVGCNDDNDNDNDSGSPTEPTGVPSDPGPGNLAGKVTGTMSGSPLAGVTVSVGNKAAGTDTNGIFQLNNVGEGILAVVISGNSIYTRTAAVNTASQGRSVALDAIERDSTFNLGFYRELARGNHPNERNLYQTHRWVTQPTFYIDTDASVTLDGQISDEQINRVKDVISTVVPVFTGNVYSSDTIRTQAFRRLDFDLDIPDNAYVISFDDRLVNSSAYGYTETAPDFVSPTTSTIGKTIIRLLDGEQFYTSITMEEIVAHEMGHGFGFRHTSLLPSVMVPVGAYGGLFSDFDRLHMAVAYHRPAGNMDIDNDPIPGAKSFGRPLGHQVFIDQRANFPVAPEVREQIRALPNKLPDIGVAK